MALGEFWVLLPEGHYTLIIQRGLEYRAVTREIEVRAGGRYEEKIELRRWINMNKKGWYSGDLHNHRDWKEMATLLLSEDLNLAARLTQWASGDRAPWVGPPPAGMEAIHQVDATHAYSIFDTEFERLGVGPGAISVFGLPALFASPGYRLSPPNSAFAELAHRQGAFVDEEKIVWRDSAALVALGHIDFAGLVYNHFNPALRRSRNRRRRIRSKRKARIQHYPWVSALGHGCLLQVSKLWIPPSGFCRNGIGHKAVSTRILSGVCSLSRGFQLSQLVQFSKSGEEFRD